MNVSTVILAAGQGTRMHSDLPKVLHKLAGRPMLAHVIDTAQGILGGRIHVVYGHHGARVREELAATPVTWVLQNPQLGTGHAVTQALPDIPDDAVVLVLYADVPLLLAETMQRLLDQAAAGALALLTVEMEDPRGYGRIVRDEHGAVHKIVEDKDTLEHERQVREVNTGIMAVSASRLRNWLSRVDDRNAQREYYLTDVVEKAVADGYPVSTTQPEHAEEVLGVNDRVQLAMVERIYQQRYAQNLMLKGVTLLDPNRFDVRGSVTVGRDVVIDVNVVLEGDVVIGDRVSIGPNTYVRDARIDDDVTVFPNSVIEEATIGAGSRIGPYSRLRPGTKLAAGVHVGNFVEIKKTTVASASKINHLSYIGDCTVGRDVNIGAGTITCNYDGANKHPTVIGDRAFIGSDTQLVAPVTVEEGATIAAGSTITKDAPADRLTLVKRNEQITVATWVRPQKKQT